MPRKNKDFAPIDQNASFTAYLKEFEAFAHNTPAAEAFLQSVREAEEKFRELHERDAYGRVRMLTAQDRDQLLAMQMEIGKNAEELLKEENPAEYKTMVRKIASLASGNYNSLRAYSPEDPKTLPEILEDVRAIRLDLRNVPLKNTVGAKQSSRQPITFLNDSGQVVTGVFTPKKTFNVAEKFQNDLNALASRPGTRPEAARILTTFTEKYFQNYGKIYQDRKGNPAKRSGDAEKDLNVLFTSCCDKEGNFDASILELVVDELYDDEFPNGFASGYLKKSELKDMIRLFDKYGVELGANSYSAGIAGGSRIDNRNAAMSTVADLLGVPDLVARSRPMKIINKNGQEVEGTFMTQAKGMDTANLSVDAININEDSLRHTDGNALKSVADLQVLDYICGNIDRHGGNVFYQFDVLGKITGIQGIDNDSSFGTYVPVDGRNKNRLVGTDNMMVMSESMCRKMMKLSGPELRFALRGYGLSEKELDAASKRMNFLKHKIIEDNEYYRDRLARMAKGEKVSPPGKFVPGRIRVVQDADFRTLSFRELSRIDKRIKHKHRNLFAIVDENVCLMADLYKMQSKDYEELKSRIAIGEDNRANPANLEVGEAATSGLLRVMRTRTIEGWWKWHHGTSQKFEAMRAAVKAYNDYQKELLSRHGLASDPEAKKNPDLVLRSVIGVNDLAKLSALGKKINSTADAYLQDKEGRNNNSYTRSRMEIAVLAREFGRKAMETKPEEKELARKNENRAEQRYNHLLADMDIKFRNSPELKNDPKNTEADSLGYTKKEGNGDGLVIG